MLRSIIAATFVAGSAVAATPASAQSLVPCAHEHEFCRVPYPTQVVYGVPGRSTALDVRGRGVPCSNEVFGDPAQGIPKRCAYVARGYGEGRYEGYYRGFRERRYGATDGASDWRTCAPENGFCSFGGTRRVRYGARGRFVEGTYRGGIARSNSIFGDPVPGQPKLCQVLD